MVKLSTIVLVLMILIGCSPTSKLRRAERLIKQAEAAGADWRHDTTFVKVPVFVTQTTIDTLFVTKPGDTVVLNRDRLHVKYINLPGDSVFIEGKCDSLIRYIKVPVTVENIIHAPKPFFKWWAFLAFGVVIGLVVALLLR